MAIEAEQTQQDLRATSMHPLWRKQTTFHTKGDPELVGMYKGAGAFIAMMVRQFKGKGFLGTTDERISPFWLTMTGQPGCGKTHLAKEIYDFCRTKMASGYYENREFGKMPWYPNYRWVQSLTVLRDYGYGAKLDEVFDAHLVIIDDLGAERDPTAARADLWMQIAEKRLGKWTVWTSNLTLEDIGKQISERLASRMIRGGSVVINSKAGDWNRI